MSSSQPREFRQNEHSYSIENAKFVKAEAQFFLDIDTPRNLVDLGQLIKHKRQKRKAGRKRSELEQCGDAPDVDPEQVTRSLRLRSHT